MQLNADIDPAIVEAYRLRNVAMRVPLKGLVEQALGTYLHILDARLEDADAYGDLHDGHYAMEATEAFLDRYRKLVNFHALYAEINSKSGDEQRLRDASAAVIAASRP